MNEAPPEFNENLIDYPSDLLTLKSLRARQVKLDDCGEDLEIMHMCEKDFGALGFATGLGNSDAIELAKLRITGWDEEKDGPYNEARELQCARDDLAKAFVRFGVADGMESAHQLIRRLEDQAAAKARQQLGGRQP